MQYVPLWLDIIDGPCWKLLDLPPEVFRFYTLCLLAAQKFDFVEGFLPDERTLAAWLHMDRDTTVTLRDIAVTCHVLDRTDDGQYKIHDWEHWRNTKDPTAAARKRKQRAKEKEVTSNVTDESRNGHAPVTDMSGDVTPHITDYNSQQTTHNRQGENAHAPVTYPDSPEEIRVCNLAAEIGGDLSWSLWALRRLQLGDSVEILEAALSEAVNAGKVNQAYVAKIAVRLKRDGLPKVQNYGASKPRLHDPGPTNQPAGAQNPPDGLEQFTAEADRLRAIARAKGIIA